MPRLYCPACRLRFPQHSRASTLGKCPRCAAITPGWSAVDANAWLASTVLAELRAARREKRDAARPPPGRAASARTAS